MAMPFNESGYSLGDTNPKNELELTKIFAAIWDALSVVTERAPMLLLSHDQERVATVEPLCLRVFPDTSVPLGANDAPDKSYMNHPATLAVDGACAMTNR